MLAGNHSYCHANNKYSSFYADPQNVLKDFRRNAEVLGVPSNIARLPGRNIWQIGNRAKYDTTSGQEAAQLLHKEGYAIFGWDVEWRQDHSTKTCMESVSEIINAVARKFDSAFTPGHVVILTHDQMFVRESEIAKLDQLLSELSKQDYDLAHLTDYPLAVTQSPVPIPVPRPRIYCSHT